MNHLLIYAMASYVFYIFVILGLSLRVRLQAVKENQISAKFFKSYQGDRIPEKVIVYGRHFDNQFQLPILFLLTCLVHLHLGEVGLPVVAMAWLFVLTRLIHSWVHLRSNKLLWRMRSYAAGMVVILVLWLQALILL